MASERSRQIEELYQAASERGPAERAAFLVEACAGDAELQHEVESLLAQTGSNGLLKGPARDEGTTLTITSRIDDHNGRVVIGSYELIRQLGEGGMGIVYHAQQFHPIRRQVALKIIKPGMDSKRVIARFETERQALALMEHPNIARVFDAGATSTGHPYFAMELVDGVPITRYCDTKRLTVRERIQLFVPVCNAIQHAHQKGIIHRDIKPSNILVAEREGEPVPKVIDFGLAKALGHELDDATMMTNFGTIVGTAEYMSPEQADGLRRDTDTRSDVYSLGVVLYELLCGDTPLEHKRAVSASPFDTLQRIRSEEPARPSARIRKGAASGEIAANRRTGSQRLAKLVAGELDWIVTRALEKERARRYQSVNDLARDLERYLEGEPVEAGPLSAAYRMRKFARKHRRWLAVAAAFAALLLAGAVVSAWMAVRANRAEQEARAVVDFLRNDLLSQASSNKQADSGRKPDPDLKVRTALDRAAATIDRKFAKQPLVEAAVRDTIGQAYDDLGRYAEAERHYERALDLRRGILGEMHPDTLSTMANLAQAYDDQGKYQQAEPLAIKTLDGRRRKLGPDDPGTLSSTTDLAEVYQGEGKYSLAEPLYTKVLDTRRRLLGANHPDTLDAMSSLEWFYIDERKFAQAEPLATAVLQTRRRVLGEEHPDTLSSLHRLVLLYWEEGRLAEAEPLAAKVVQARRRVLGEEDPDTLDSMINLAVIYQDEVKLTQAETILARVVDIYRRKPGEADPDSLTAAGDLAVLYRQEGKYSQAEPLFAQVLQGRSHILGEENPDTLLSMTSLGILYLLEGKYTQAEPLLTKALDGRRRVLGAENLDTLASMNYLAELDLNEQKFPACESLAGEAARIFEKQNSDNWRRWESQYLQGACVAAQGRYAEAEPLLLAGYNGLLQRKSVIPPRNRSSLKEAAQRTVELYRLWGKPDQAAVWRQAARAQAK